MSDEKQTTIVLRTSRPALDEYLNKCEAAVKRAVDDYMQRMKRGEYSTSNNINPIDRY